MLFVSQDSTLQPDDTAPGMDSMFLKPSPALTASQISETSQCIGLGQSTFDLGDLVSESFSHGRQQAAGSEAQSAGSGAQNSGQANQSFPDVDVGDVFISGKPSASAQNGTCVCMFMRN